MNLEKEVDGIVEFIKDQVNGANKAGCVVGVSGGVDSAVIAALCKKVYPNTTYGVLMHKLEDNKFGNSYHRAVELCKQLGIYQLKQFIQQDELLVMNQNVSPLAMGNYCARLRMAKLYFEAEVNNCLVVGTDNRCENFIGYFTKYGDGGVDINPIGQYYKSEVFELGRYMNISESILNATPSAELYKDQTDEDELGVTYNQIESAIGWLEGKDPDTLPNYAMDIVHKVDEMHARTEHKRILPLEYQRSQKEGLTCCECCTHEKESKNGI